MTKRERLLAVMRGEIPDCVPVCPDISNMVPARMTGKPFWDIYVHQDPPLWKAHMNACKYFDIDGGYEMYDFGDLFGDEGPVRDNRIVRRNKDGSFITREYCEASGEWDKFVVVHTADNPPATNLYPDRVGLPDIPTEWEPITNVKQWPKGLALWKMIKKEMGEDGVVGMPSGMSTLLLENPEDIYAYFENPKPFYKERERMEERVNHRMKIIASLDEKPDFLFCGSSGSLVFQSPDIFRELVLPLLQKTTRMAAELGIPTHVHSCGPETQLVKMAANETDLTIIDPLEIPPMGDCNLAELKKLYGDKIILKGNLHTTSVMLEGSVDDVVKVSKQAIDDAAAGGGFILSTGDQCGRDTPDENLFAMVDTARTYGKY